MKWVIAMTVLVGAGAPAMACNCVRFIADHPRFETDVAAVLEQADVVAEGVIEQPMGDLLEPAVFRPTRILKGPVRDTYRIGVISDCALVLGAADFPPGTRVRLILHGGPDLYEAQRCVNLLGADFDAAVTRRLAPHCPRR